MQFWRTQTYKKQAKRLGLSENELKAIEDEVAQNPDAGDVVPGLKGARKIRVAFGNKGKRGGGRAIYVVLLSEDTTYMILIYAKSEREDLSKEDKEAVIGFIKVLTEEKK